MARSRRQEKSWLFQDFGGMPNWATVAVFCVLGAMALFVLWDQSRSEAAVAWTPPPEPTASPTPSATPTGPEDVLFIGDSYVKGAGASGGEFTWAALVSEALGWDQHNEAFGGTGYVATSGAAGCGLDYCPNYSEAIEQSDADPDLVVISGGRNDGPLSDGEVAPVESTIEAAQAKWPDAEVAVTSPIWDDDVAPDWLFKKIDAVQEAATETGATYVDLGQPLEGEPGHVVDDGVHPNDAGHAAIAAAFLEAWPAT